MTGSRIAPPIAGLLLCFALASCSSSKKEEKSIVAAPTLPEETILENAINTYDKQLYRVSLQNWTDLRDGYPTSYYSTLAELKIADAHFYTGDYPAALVAYEEFAKLHPGHEAMAYVRYQIGNCHLRQYRDIKRDQAPLQAAITAFQQLIDSNPRSEYVVLARRRLLHCRELQAAYERYVASFYERRGFETAATSRMEHLSRTFPESQVMAQAAEVSPTPGAETEGKASAAPAGKAPSAPKVLARNGLDASDYVTALSSLSASRAPMQEENLIGAKAVARSAKPDEPPPPQGAVESFECEEVENGALFTITLKEEVNAEPEEEDEALRFVFLKPSTAAPAEDRCSAGGIGVELKSGPAGVRVRRTDDDFHESSVLVLNRPQRIVLSIPK